MSFDSLIGKLLWEYEIQELIGRGGMGAVYRAYHIGKKHEVAIKVLSTSLTTSPEYLKRFEREIRVNIKLGEHPHIVPFLDYGTDDQQFFVVMRYFKDGSLQKYVKENRVSLRAVSRWIGQVSDALDYAHRQNVIHRDVKLDNILLDLKEDKVYLSDFGIAKATDYTQLTTSGTMGTARYMAPEMVFSDHFDGRADIYSLGILIFRVLAGAFPFNADNDLMIMQEHRNTPIPRLSEYNKELPPALDHVIFKALAKKPENRYVTCGAMAAALAEIVEKHEPQAKSQVSTLLDRFTTSKKRRKATVTDPVTPSTGVVDIKVLDEALRKISHDSPAAVDGLENDPLQPHATSRRTFPYWVVGTLFVIIGLTLGIGLALLLAGGNEDNPEKQSRQSIAQSLTAPALTLTLNATSTTSEINMPAGTGDSISVLPDASLKPTTALPLRTPITMVSPSQSPTTLHRTPSLSPTATPTYTLTATASPSLSPTPTPTASRTLKPTTTSTPTLEPRTVRQLVEDFRAAGTSQSFDCLLFLTAYEYLDHQHQSQNSEFQILWERLEQTENPIQRIYRDFCLPATAQMISLPPQLFIDLRNELLAVETQLR